MYVLILPFTKLAKKVLNPDCITFYFFHSILFIFSPDLKTYLQVAKLFTRVHSLEENPVNGNARL